MGKSTINGLFSMAMSNSQRVASSKVAMEAICIQQAHELMAGPGRDIIKLK